MLRCGCVGAPPAPVSAPQMTVAAAIAPNVQSLGLEASPAPLSIVAEPHPDDSKWWTIAALVALLLVIRWRRG